MKTKRSPKWCPITFSTEPDRCCEDDCAWWGGEENECCSIQDLACTSAIAANMEGIMDRLSEIIEILRYK